MDLDGLEALKQLQIQLLISEIARILTLMNTPEAICEKCSKGVAAFLMVMRQWGGHKPYLFYKALRDTRPDLIQIACIIPWLCVSTPSPDCNQDEELSIKSLIDLLKTEITKDNWILIYMSLAVEANDNIDFELTLNKMLEKQYIQRDLITLSETLKRIQRDDLAEQLKAYRVKFAGMEDGEFETKFKREVKLQAKEIQMWECLLKQYLQSHFKNIQQMLGEDNSVSLEYVYVELTILKQEPKEVNINDETTYNEIALLRRIGESDVNLNPVDFTKELKSYKTDEPEIWCLIGNPGCGKTFLAKRTALRFSKNELTGILYSISIPCRNTDWHTMESTRYGANKKVESEYIQKWLCLGLPTASNWSNDLAKHLNQTDGEGLLLIIDGLDEFTKKVPFKDTLLFLLLTRQSLIRSTIIITSRPGAWTDVSSNHELNINRFYQVLGFSPENRDLYFEKQIENETKLKECRRLLSRYDEMNQLSLIPVNASLFAALLKGDDSTLITTLSNLYSELTLYVIRRELTRMSLEAYSRVTRISNLHPDILHCLNDIGFIAFLGVANRDLASEENVTLIIGEEEYTCHCLGLAHEHFTKKAVGVVKKVWTFAHLTMQEFTAALWQSNLPWNQQCVSIRYISHSNANFTIFKMVVRFLCGLLNDDSAAILSILYRYLIPHPMLDNGLPTSYKQGYEALHCYKEEWAEFTQKYFELAASLYETASKSINLWFTNFQQYFPTPISFYVENIVSPNEWICFLQSLELVSTIKLIFIKTENINPIQLKYLLQKLRICSVGLLTLRFYGKDSNTVVEFCDRLRSATELQSISKINIELNRCDLRDVPSLNRLSPKIRFNLYSMVLLRNQYSTKLLEQLAYQVSTLTNSYLYAPRQIFNRETRHFEQSRIHSESLVPALFNASQLRVLHLYDIPAKFTRQLIGVLPKLSMLEEVGIDNYALMPPLCELHNLKFIKITDRQTQDLTLRNKMTQLIDGNMQTLKGLKLAYMHRIGFNRWSLLLDSLKLCSSLVQLQLEDISLPLDGVKSWRKVVHNMTSLVDLALWHVTLYDIGLLSLCSGIILHPTIKKLSVQFCKLTSLSCTALMNLILTPTKLEILEVTDLSNPEAEPIKLLKETADLQSIDYSFR